MSSGQLTTTRLDKLTGALAPQIGAATKLGPRHYEFCGVPRQPIRLTADGEWLHIESVLPRPWRHALPGPRRSQRLLACNALLPAGICYAVGPRSCSTYIQAAVPIPEQSADHDELTRHVSTLCAAFQRVLDRPAVSCQPVATPTAYVPLAVDDTAGAEMVSLCEAGGWEHHERGNGQLAFTLDVPGQFCQAYPHRFESGEFRLSTIMESPSHDSLVSQHAAAAFLLTASRVVRLARAVRLKSDGQVEYRWEVAWDQPPSRRQFDFGMSALSMACRLSVRELPALADEKIAESYLELRGRNPQ